MVIPRFTVRWLLALMAVCGVIAFVVSLAVAGHHWAIAMTFAVIFFLGTMVLHAATFCIAWAMNRGWQLVSHRERAASPFATHTPPPQIVISEEPD